MNRRTTIFTPRQIKLLEFIKQLGYHESLNGEPFITTSGKSTMFYYDMRRVLAFPTALRLVVEELDELIPDNIKSVGGMAVGALPLLVAFALHRKIPYYYVRKERKQHGMQNNTEGADVQMPTWILDDVYNTGASFQHCREEITNYYADGKIPEEVSHEGVFMFMGHCMSTKGSVVIDRDDSFYGDNPREYSIKAVNSIFTHQQFLDYLHGNYEVAPPPA